MMPIGQLLVPIGLMIALLIVGMIIFVWLRRYYLDDADNEQGAGLTLHQLRTLKAEGKLSEQEYEMARLAILGQAGAQTPPDSPSDQPPPTDPPDQKTPD